FRLSLQQERAWSQHERGVPQIAQAVVRITGSADEPKLREVLRAIVTRYEILRTHFRKQTGVKLPFQVIQEEPELHFEHLSGNDAESSDLVCRERNLRRDLEHGPSLRAVLFSIRPDQHRLILTLPAFCADAATLRNLAHEVRSVYCEAE